MGGATVRTDGRAYTLQRPFCFRHTVLLEGARRRARAARAQRPICGRIPVPRSRPRPPYPPSPTPPRPAQAPRMLRSEARAVRLSGRARGSPRRPDRTGYGERGHKETA